MRAKQNQNSNLDEIGELGSEEEASDLCRLSPFGDWGCGSAVTSIKMRQTARSSGSRSTTQEPHWLVDFIFPFLCFWEHKWQQGKSESRKNMQVLWISTSHCFTPLPLKEVAKLSPESGVSAELVNGSFEHWKGFIKGPVRYLAKSLSDDEHYFQDDSPYSGGLFVRFSIITH